MTQRRASMEARFLRVQKVGARPAPPAPQAPAPGRSEAKNPDPAGPTFDPEAFALNAKVAGLLKARYGPSWPQNRALQRLGARAIADLRGAGNGRALRALRATTGNGSYAAALDSKFGPI
jgi:hypothetical protein